VKPAGRTWRQWIASTVRPSQAMMMLAAVLIIAIATGLTLEIVHRLRYEIEGTIRENTNLAHMLAEETSRSLETVDLIVRSATADLTAQGVTSSDAFLATMGTEAVQSALRERLIGAPQLDAITLIAANGKVINFSRQWPIPEINVAHLDYFKALSSNPTLRRFISGPVQNRGTGTWTMFLARSIRASDGSFIGLVLGAIALEHIERLYAKMALGPSGSILLARSDGLVLVRQPAIKGVVGSSIAAAPAFRALIEGSMTFEGKSQADGLVRIMAARPVGDLPLMIAVTQLREEALADWRRQSTSLAIAGTAIVAFIVAAFWLLVRHVARREVSARMFGAALENMSQGIMMIDAGRRVRVCNQRAVDLLDLPAQLMASQPLFDDVLRAQWRSGEFGIDGENLEEQVRMFVRSGGILDQPQTYQRARPNGAVIEIKSIPLDGGGIVRTFTDITGAKEAEATLTAARDAANHSAQVKAEFLATMSHEIRSPMSGLLGVLDLLRDTNLDPEQTRMAEMVTSSASALLVVLNEILDLSKIEAGALAIVPTVTNLYNLVAEVVQLHRAAAAPKSIPVELTIGEDVPGWVSVDGFRVRQIVNNLLSNAVKFTRAGKISVSLDTIEQENTKTLRFICRDTGLGMSAGVVERLFEPFMQADGSTTRDFGGTGLGLSISRRLARLLGGDLLVSSQQYNGSVFTLVLPLVVADATQVPNVMSRRPPRLQHPLKGRRILLVEDDPTNQWLVTRQLEGLGLHVTVAQNGEAALDALRVANHDAVVTDCHMPKMDGVALTRAIRNAPDVTLNSLPIIGLTADVTAAQRQRCQAAGMSEMMIKPVAVEQLHQVLVRHLPTVGRPDAASFGEPARDRVPIFNDCVYRELFSPGDPEGPDFLGQFLIMAESLAIELQVLTVGPPAGAVDRGAVVTAAHQLAGSSLSVGALRLGRTAQALEQAARALEDAADETDRSVLRELGVAVQDQLVAAQVAISGFLVTVDAEPAA
jgi:signal transduction histidine kinase/ActR/RegA family two-component response regulator/HPt (histidine-containing phosphotransfer) domain-containing protein